MRRAPALSPPLSPPLAIAQNLAPFFDVHSCAILKKLCDDYVIHFPVFIE